MKTAKIRISKERLRQLVAEELRMLHNEQVDHEGVKTVVTSSSKLLKAAEAFKKDATAAMTNALTPALDQLISVLEDMVSNPSSYVDKPKVGPRRIKLRRVDSDD